MDVVVLVWVLCVNVVRVGRVVVLFFGIFINVDIWIRILVFLIWYVVVLVWFLCVGILWVVWIVVRFFRIFVNVVVVMRILIFLVW